MHDRHEERDSLWGIDANDRRWFQALTLAGGLIASIIMVFLEIQYRAADAGPNTIARNILLSIGASFVAAGFVSWAILQAKELTMAIADWIRDANEKRKRELVADARSEALIEGIRQGRIEGHSEGLDEGIRQGRIEGRTEGLNEGYLMGYDDSEEGKPRRPPTNGANPDGNHNKPK